MPFLLRLFVWPMQIEVAVIMEDLKKCESGDKDLDAPVEGLTPCADKSILLVDDEKAIRRLFQMILRSGLPGYNIELAANGAEAVESFTAEHHKLLLMDLHMPVMDGQTAFSEIQKLCESKKWEMPSVVFCTGFAPPDLLRSIVNEDERHCILAKPISGQVLTDTIKGRL